MKKSKFSEEQIAYACASWRADDRPPTCAGSSASARPRSTYSLTIGNGVNGWLRNRARVNVTRRQ